MRGSPTGRTCPRPRSCCRRPRPGRTTGSGSSPRGRAALRRAPTLGTCHAWLEAGGVAPRPGRSSRSAAPGWSASATDGRLAGVRRAAAAAVGPVGGGAPRADRRRRSASAGTRSSTPSGPTTGPAGWPSCSRTPRRCSRCEPRPVDRRHRRGRALPAGLAARLRGARVLPARQHGGGPGDRQPERLASPSGCCAPAASPPPTSPRRARRSAVPDGSASPRTRRRTSGWAATSSPASAATWRSDRQRGGER